MNKKVLLSLILIGVLAIGAGMGTYAWFTTSATSGENTFDVGTLYFDGDESHNGLELGELFAEKNAQPTCWFDAYNFAYFDLKNAGTLPMLLKADFRYEFANNPENIDKDTLGNKYMVEVMMAKKSQNTSTKNSESKPKLLTKKELDGILSKRNAAKDADNCMEGEDSFTYEGYTYWWMLYSVDEIQEKLNNHFADFYDNNAFQPNKTIHCWTQMYLDKTAGNDFQGININTTLTFTGTQTNAPK